MNRILLPEAGVLLLAVMFAGSVLAADEAAPLDLPVPTPEQLAWQNLEIIAFAHFGMNTFTDREWGDGTEDPKLFNPSGLDARQWVKALRPAGVKLLILTAKHHDGFCLWPSRHTEHSVKNSPWREGKGDVVREVADACRESGMQFGVYLSPWDRHEKSYGSPAYNLHFLSQLRELLTDYGPVAEVWFDGACGEGPNGKRQEYDWAAYYRLIRELQPKALIAISGPDIRWVGNENGLAREEETSVQPANPGMHPGRQRVWWPAECDVSIRPGWFYQAGEDGRVKSLDHLMKIYDESVGRNATLLLNVPPDQRGLIHENDVRRLAEFGAEVSRRFGHSLAECGGQGREIELELQPPRVIDHIVLMEDILHGERVQGYVLEGRRDGAWRELARGQVVGHKKIHRVEPQAFTGVRLRATHSTGDPRIRRLAVFNTAMQVPASQLAWDPHRPSYHFLPPSNWMNDPNGLIQFNGEYHLFYQHNPEASVWGNMTWGHAVSRDLVHWRHLPLALHPDQPYDKGGVFSGCMVNDNGVATAVYTGVSPEVQCIATSRDLLAWEKHAGNPVIPGPPPGLKVTGFRDPCVWKQEGTWHMGVGSGIEGRGGTVLLYKSRDLRSWDYVGPALIGDQAETGPMWECPSLFPLGDRWILVVSPYRPPIYFTGRFENDRFTPENQGDVDLGGDFYAPQLFRDESGRLLMFGWLKEAREGAERAGWQGVQSLPRVITLGSDGRPRYAPAKEVDSLRGPHQQVRHLAVEAGSQGHLGSMQGRAIEILAEVDPAGVERAGLRICRSPDGREETRVLFDRRAGRLILDRTRSSLDPAARKDAPWAPLALAPGEPLRLRVYVDHSVVEVFANDRTCLTGRIYPTRPDSVGVDLLAEGGTCRAITVDCWQMRSAWDDQTR